MQESSAHIAVDLGAESGRVVLGIVQDGRVQMHLCARFEHAPVETGAGLCWDLAAIWREVRSGLAQASAQAKELGVTPVSVGVDSWAVDYAMLSAEGELSGPPRCYRDPAFANEFARITADLGPDRLYRETGIQLQPFNTLYQYAARFRSDPARYGLGSRLLFVPDVLHWLLSGEVSNELTNASTSQMMAVGAPSCGTGKAWNRALLGELGLPVEPLVAPKPPASTIGTLLPDIAEETGLDPTTRVILPPTHDTAAAVAAIPALPGSRWCFLSSGTWSLLGAELESPCLTDGARALNFTNELGVDGTVRFLKNISGLWLVQQVRRECERAGESHDYDSLTAQAEAAAPLRTLFPVDLPEILGARSIVDAIQSYAERTGQPRPQSTGEVVRSCLESLALQYAVTLDQLERVLDERFDVMHVVGGGSRNHLLNQMTANATGRRIVAGPAEASALGNALVQAIGAGAVRDLAHLRAIVAASECHQAFEPDVYNVWQGARQRYRQLLHRQEPPGSPGEAV